MTSTAQQRRDEAGLRLVGRGLLESLVAGMAIGPIVVLLMLLIFYAADLADIFRNGNLGQAAAYGFFALVIATPVGLAGGVLALVVLGVVTRYRASDWATSRTAWLAPAVTVGVATVISGVLSGLWWFYLAAAPAAAITAWRGQRAVTRYANATAVPSQAPRTTL
ncbi:hypothetical protein [Jannaschia sp. R86511]|uniref:hypothetical protein n=1 Tax=Jannaschia sp. R86511 TaxID=3093853 RepID=UPI0036D39A40